MNDMKKIYQWTKGDRYGEIVKTYGDKTILDGEEYLAFTDGTIINKGLISEYLIELPTEHDAFQVNTPQPVRTPSKPKEAQLPPPSEQIQESPIRSLLLTSKKSKETFTVSIDIDLPSIDLMKIVADSYEDGEEQILKYISSMIPMETVKETIADQIKKTAFDKKSKINERISDTSH